VYQPAGGAFFLYFTNWTFVLFGATALLGAALTARVSCNTGTQKYSAQKYSAKKQHAEIQRTENSAVAAGTHSTGELQHRHTPVQQLWPMLSAHSSLRLTAG
jgi:hypothetical protein